MGGADQQRAEPTRSIPMGTITNHNQTLVRAELSIRIANHNQTVARPEVGINPNHNQTLVRR
jgi:hypothetical protein